MRTRSEDDRQARKRVKISTHFGACEFWRTSARAERQSAVGGSALAKPPTTVRRWPDGERRLLAPRCRQADGVDPSGGSRTPDTISRQRHHSPMQSTSECLKQRSLINDSRQGSQCHLQSTKRASLTRQPGETPDRGCPGTEDDKGPTLSDALRRVAARSDTSTGLLFTPQIGYLGDRFGNGRPTLRGGVAPNSRPVCKPVRCLFRAPARSHPTNPGYFHTSSVVLPTAHTSHFHTECGASKVQPRRPPVYIRLATADRFYIRQRAGCRPAASVHLYSLHEQRCRLLSA